jgi:glycerol-3-phosphate dehydrogenase (NAD(P)+)
MNYDTVVVLAAGAFGTSIGSVLAENFKKVIFLVRSQDVYDGLKNFENTVYLPGQKLPKNIVPVLDFDGLKVELKNSKLDLIVSGLPTSVLQNYCEQNQFVLSELLKTNIPLVSLAKGIDPETLEMPDDIFYENFPLYKEQICFLSGPSFAKEIVDKQITLVSIAGKNRQYLDLVSLMFQTSYFKIFKSYDVKGLLLGGALKNILAIAGGIVEGLGFNHNTRAAMITRGISEMLRYGQVFNARPETFYGLSGMGDLILTTTGGLSRNKIFGLEIAKGRNAKEIIESQRSVVEGYKTAKAAKLLAEKYQIRARIFEGVYQVLYENKAPEDIIKSFMKLSPRFEID